VSVITDKIGKFSCLSVITVVFGEILKKYEGGNLNPDGLTRFRNKRNFVSEGIGDFCDGLKSGMSVFGKRLIEGSTGNPGSLGGDGHSFSSPGDIRKGDR
jgi:hypothetical protein